MSFKGGDLVTLFDWKSEAESEWDKRASFWNKKSRDLWENGSRKDIISFISSYLEKGSKILDIGCGDGYGTFKLNQKFKATGLDLSNEMIRLAKQRFENELIPFVQGDVNVLPFADNEFDAMMAINVLEWVENPYDALMEMKRVLKKGGSLFVGVLGPTAGPRANSYPRLLGEKTICNTMMPWEFTQLAAELSLEQCESFGVYKAGVEERHYVDLPLKLQQSLSFMWVFRLINTGEKNE